MPQVGGASIIDCYIGYRILDIKNRHRPLSFRKARVVSRKSSCYQPWLYTAVGNVRRTLAREPTLVAAKYCHVSGAAAGKGSAKQQGLTVYVVSYSALYSLVLVKQTLCVLSVIIFVRFLREFRVVSPTFRSVYLGAARCRTVARARRLPCRWKRPDKLSNRSKWRLELL